MKNIFTNTTATFTAANGMTVNCQEVFEAVKTSVEIFGKRGGRDLSDEELEDLFQDSVLKALKYSGSFDPERSKAKTWASRIAQNAQRDAYRDHVTRGARFVTPSSGCEDGEEPYGSYLDNLAGGFKADREVETSESMERVQRAIDSLSENQQFILSLHLQGMKPKKMAEHIGCTADAAATLLCRARKALRRALGESFLAQNGIAS